MTVFPFFVLFYNNNKIENDDCVNFILFEPRNEELNEAGKIVVAKDSPSQSRNESLKKIRLAWMRTLTWSIPVQRSNQLSYQAAPFPNFKKKEKKTVVGSIAAVITEPWCRKSSRDRSWSLRMEQHIFQNSLPRKKDNLA